MEGNLRCEIDWASPIVGEKFTVFALFYFAFEGNFQVQAPGGGLIFGGACTWRGLFSEFYGICFAPTQKRSPVVNSTSTCVS